jgi:lipopolysaccharide transport protein LptA
VAHLLPDLYRKDGATAPAFSIGGPRLLALLLPMVAIALLGTRSALSAGVSRGDDITVTYGRVNSNFAAGTTKMNNLVIEQGTGTRIQAAEGSGTGIDGGFKNTHWTLNGDVHLEFEGTVLDADAATVQFANGRVVAASVDGSPSRFSRTGNNGRTLQGTAPAIRYEPASGWVHFGGRTWFSNGTLESQGNSLSYNVKTSTLTDDGDVGTRESLIWRRERAPDVPTPRTPDRSTAQ